MKTSEMNVNSKTYLLEFIFDDTGAGYERSSDSILKLDEIGIQVINVDCLGRHGAGLSAADAGHNGLVRRRV